MVKIVFVITELQSVVTLKIMRNPVKISQLKTPLKLVCPPTPCLIFMCKI